MKKLKLFFWITLSFLIPATAIAQQTDAVDTAMVSKIKEEGLKRSQVMDILSMLTDIHGPRLTNSTGFRKAAMPVRSTLPPGG